MDMDPATALSATPTKEATHLSMTACHNHTTGIFVSCHVSVSSSTASAHTSPDSSESVTAETRRLYYGRKIREPFVPVSTPFPSAERDRERLRYARSAHARVYNRSRRAHGAQRIRV